MSFIPDLEQNIGDALERFARNQPTAPAIHVPGRTSLSYADLGAQICYVRERFDSWGIARSDVIVGVVPSRPEMAVACATVPTAAIFAPLSPAFTTDVYAELLARMCPKALLVPGDRDHPVRAAARRRGVSEISLASVPSAPAGTFTLELASPLASPAQALALRPDLAYLLTTSGTTGRPKLVPRSHCQFILNAQYMGDCYDLATSDVGCHLLPMHHGHGLNTGLIIPLLRGAAVVCLPESDTDRFFEALDAYRITWLPAAFTHYRELLRRADDFRDTIDRSALRFMLASSGRLEPDEVDNVEQTFGVPLLTGFGMTEARMITVDPLPPRMRKRGSVGVPLCNQVAIRCESGNICSTGQVGEVIVRGPLVFDGYVDDLQATTAAFTDGWFCTGDLGYFDEDGYLFLQGRVKEIINRGGEKISPAEIDSTIEALAGIREAAAFAIPHPTLGEEVAAAVVKNADAEVAASDIIEQVRRRMGPKRAPRQIFFVEQLPRTELGKIRRSELPRLLGLDQMGAAAADQLAVKSPTPMSALEAALAGLWSSVLQVGNFGVNDDFFLLGGDSLRGARLLTSVRAVFGVDLPIESLFRNAATVAGMARAIEAARSR